MRPKVLQCDGSYLAGGITSHPTPLVFVEQQSTTPGLKIGQRRLSVLTGTTSALWRFDGDYEAVVSTGYAIGCPSGCCKSYYYNYISNNGSANLRTGLCSYQDAVNNNCSNLAVMTTFGANQPRAQLGACPADPSTLPIASSSFSITASGPRGGESTLGLSSTSLQLNGVDTFATANNSVSWDLPVTYTLAAWINTSAAGRIVSQQSGSNYWGLGVTAGGLLRHFDSRDAGVGADLSRNTGSSLLIGGWHLVHLVRLNGVSRRYYIDGRFAGTAPASSTNSFTSHPINATLEIGRRGDVSSEFFSGSIDDVRILTEALSDDDIMLEYDTQIHKYSADSGVTFSTFAGVYSGSPANGTAAAVTYTPPEAYSATSRWIFEAQNINGESSVSFSYGVTIDNAPPVAPGLSAAATTINDITWSWGLPPRVCLPPGSASVTYDLVNAANNATLIGSMAQPTFTVGENLPGSPNQILGRRLRVTDTWGSGLSAPTSIYTLANPPLANSVVPTLISTGSALISWNQNGNPAYTRWLLSYSVDPLFSTGVSTPVPFYAHFKGSSYALSGLAIGSTYYARVQAFSGRSTDLYGDTPTVFVSTAFTTLPAAPGLGGTPDSNVSITWSWLPVTGAQYYNLYDGAGLLLYTGSALSFPQGGRTTNTQYTARVEAVSRNGVGARSTATTFTLANDPTAPVINALYTTSATYSWNGGLNPSYTFYEVRVTTDVSFALIVATATVNATTATVTGLFPGTTYYARVRSINGSQLYGVGSANFALTVTLRDPAITTVLAPPSAYVPPSGTVGQWHFDESTGVVAADSSGIGNNGFLTCVAAGCVSTPTYTGGPAGLGSAVAFSGLDNAFVRIPDNTNYNFEDALTVSAWVMPTNLSQPSGAGIVVRGNGGVENFALDVSGGLWRFMPKPGFFASSTNTIAVNTWTHLIGVYDPALGGSATLYVNGRFANTVPGVGGRTAANHDISIGNRQSAAAAYNRGFLGGIDAVRVLHRALNAAEALSEYQGSFISTITPPSPNNTILIGLAPNAFGTPATLFVSVDPMTHPITITPAVLNAGLTVIPTGFTLIPNSLIEIVPIVAGAPFTQTLGSSASISMPYNDANGDNILDGSNPPLAASALKVYTLNTTINRWELLPSVIDPAARRVTAFTPHFSVFGMFAPTTIGTALDQVRVYPVPWRPGTGGRFDASGITFDRLPATGSVRILNLAGERIREFSFDGTAAGIVIWNGLTDSGHRTASGVYFARITGASGATTFVKFAIER